jgi:hypothetical protein
MVVAAGSAFTLYAGQAPSMDKRRLFPPERLHHAAGLLTAPSTLMTLGSGSLKRSLSPVQAKQLLWFDGAFAVQLESPTPVPNAPLVLRLPGPDDNSPVDDPCF